MGKHTNISCKHNYFYLEQQAKWEAMWFTCYQHTLCGLILNFFLPMINFFSLVFSRLKKKHDLSCSGISSGWHNNIRNNLMAIARFWFNDCFPQHDLITEFVPLTFHHLHPYCPSPQIFLRSPFVASEIITAMLVQENKKHSNVRSSTSNQCRV